MSYDYRSKDSNLLYHTMSKLKLKKFRAQFSNPNTTIFQFNDSIIQIKPGPSCRLCNIDLFNYFAHHI